MVHCVLGSIENECHHNTLRIEQVTCKCDWALKKKYIYILRIHFCSVCFTEYGSAPHTIDIFMQIKSKEGIRGSSSCGPFLGLVHSDFSM